MNKKSLKLCCCKLLSICMAILMVISIMPTGFVHADTANTEKQNYEVTVNVAPKDSIVTFYEGNDVTNQLDESQITDKGVTDEGYHQYILTVPEGRYFYQAQEGDTKLGGMTFDVPIEDEIMFDPETGGGKPSGEGQKLYLQRVDFYTNDTKIQNIDDYTIHAIPAGMPEVQCGGQYLDEENRVVTPTMVLARGNALVYTINIDINGDLREHYAVPQMPNETFSNSKAVVPMVFSLSSTVYHTITAPKGAKAQVFNQLNNFNVKEIPVKYTEENEDGTMTYKYATSGGGNLTYRVSMEGKITRAGYFGQDPESIVVTYDEKEDPKDITITAYPQRMEASTMVNVNSQNNLKLGVGDTFRLRAYRAAWQIINTDTQNIMIEPDFDYKIISGGEYIRMTPVTGLCTGNAGTGEKSNWMDIEGLAEGTAIIEVSYDTIKIGGAGTGSYFHGLYGATNPQRKSLIIINVGDTGNTLKMFSDGAEEIWDTEYDTVYFLGDTGDLTFTATLGEDAPEQVELSTDNGITWKTVAKFNEKYTAQGLVPGNNILKFTKGEHTEYQVVRGAKVTYTLTNKSHDFENLYMVGDTVELRFQGLFVPVPKFSGIYNPGFPDGGHKIVYRTTDGASVNAKGGQYTFITNHVVTIKLEEAGQLKLENGYIQVTVLGKALSQGGHRTLTDSGCGVNFSAVGTYHKRSVFPTITLDVVEKKPVSVTINTGGVGADIEVTNDAGEVQSGENGRYDLYYGNYHYVGRAKGHAKETGTFSVRPEDNEGKTVNISFEAIPDTEWDTVSVEEAPQEDGVYQISKASQLVWFAQKVNDGIGADWDAVLTKDISLGTENPWTPMMNYSGTFDGCGHYISNLYIHDGRRDNQGLFGTTTTGAVIRNLGVSGTVMAYENNYYKSYIGGIVGDAKGTTIENCVNRVDVTGFYYVGGIAGRVDVQSLVTGCYNLGIIKNTGSHGSGIVGAVVKASGERTKKMIINCYNAGTVSGNNNVGGIHYLEAGVFAKNCYYLESSCTVQEGLQAGTKVTAAELKALAPTLGAAYLTGVEEYNSGYPVLTWEEGRILSYVAEDAIADIEAYKNPADYREAQKAELSTALAAAKSAISSAKTVADVNKAAADAKAAMDAIKTDAQLKAEEEANKPVTPPTEKPEEQPTQKPDETPETPIQLTAPSKVKVSNVAKSGKVKVTWSKVEGAAKYQVYRATKKNGKYTLVKTVTGTSYTDSTTKVGKSYYFKVKAVSSDKNVTASAFSKAVKGTVVLKAPSVTAKSKTKKQVKLTWKKVSGAKKYEIYRATSKNGKYKKIATTAKLSYTNKKLKSGKNYIYKVKAMGKKKAYNSAFSTVKKCKVK